MANEEHLAILKQGVEVWNEWRAAAGATLVELAGSDLHEQVLRGADLTAVDLNGANLAVADLTQAYLGGTDLTGANLTGANLSGANLSGANLTGANLTGADLMGTDLTDANLSGTDFHFAYLHHASLIHANLVRADFRGADLTQADLRRANLDSANLTDADLTEANLTDADLTNATLYLTRLTGGDLGSAGLYGTNLSDADLGGATLRHAGLIGTVFGNTNLADAKGLEDCRFEGPCIIDHRTIERSGHLPLGFLRGCGLPDAIIDSFSSLLGQQYYSCFISYSSIDDKFANRLHADLQNNGVRCWFAPHDIAGGKKIHEQIEDAIRRYERLLLILSEHSMESDWVDTEIANARKREASEKRQVLFPIRLVDYERIQDWELFDADRGKDSAREVREYFIPDFTNWEDHDAYTESFGRLLKDLKAETTSSEAK